MDYSSLNITLLLIAKLQSSYTPRTNHMSISLLIKLNLPLLNMHFFFLSQTEQQIAYSLAIIIFFAY